MKIFHLSSIKRWIMVTGSTSSLVILSLFGFGSTLTVLAGHASAASCDVISFISGGPNGGLKLAGNGTGGLLLEKTGNCFHTIATGSSAYGTWNVWQNGDGNCIFSVDGGLALDSACTTTSGNYQILTPGAPGGDGLPSGDNFISTVSVEYNYGQNYYMEPDFCNDSEGVGTEAQPIISGSNCFYWNF